MTYVDLYEAIRTIVRQSPDLAALGEPMTDGDELLDGEGLGVDVRGWLGARLPAVDRLERAVRSPDIKVSVMDAGRRRQLAADERGYRLSLAQGDLTGPAGEPRLYGNLVHREDLERFVAPATIELAVATGAPQPVADIATANPRQSIDFDTLLVFIKNHYATARSRGERTNREKAKTSAEEHFRRIIPAKAWRNAFSKAEIDNNNGRPRNP
jgi:hypothetical protein